MNPDDKDRTIDLEQQFLELFDREQMLAYFDVGIRHGDGVASGLCKVSHPKETDPHRLYLSLLYVVDTPDDAAWPTLRELTGRMPWAALPESLPGTESVLYIPYPRSDAPVFMFETDVYLTIRREGLRTYLTTRLHPTVRGMLGEAGEIVFWEDAPAVRAAPPLAPEKTLVERIRKKLLGG